MLLPPDTPSFLSTLPLPDIFKSAAQLFIIKSCPGTALHLRTHCTTGMQAGISFPVFRLISICAGNNLPPPFLQAVHIVKLPQIDIAAHRCRISRLDHMRRRSVNYCRPQLRQPYRVQ